MQHDPSVSLLAQGSGKIVAMSGGGSTANPYDTAVGIALAAALSGTSLIPTGIGVNASVGTAAAAGSAAPTSEEIHLKETGISLKGNERSHFLLDKLTGSVINPASKPAHNATAATEYNTSALTTPAGKKTMIENIKKALDKITTDSVSIPIQVKVSTG